MAYLDTSIIGGTLYDLTDTKGRAMIAPKEETSTASAAHAKGTYFTYNDLLYRATANIAVGDTITPNTNCVAVTVGGQLGELKSAFDYLADDVNNISGDILIQPVEIGWAYISSGQIAYVSTANGARLKKGYYLRLKQGDVIHNDSPTNYDFRGGYSTDGGSTWNDISWQSATNYTVSVTGLYIFTFRDKNANISNIEQHMSHFTIIRESSALLQIESCLVAESESWED